MGGRAHGDDSIVALAHARARAVHAPAEAGSSSHTRSRGTDLGLLAGAPPEGRVTRQRSRSEMGGLVVGGAAGARACDRRS